METQSFRLIGKNDVEVIPCYQDDGQHFVYWEDVEQVFPGIRHIKNGNVTVPLMRDSNGKRYKKDINYFDNETMREKNC